VLHLNEAVMNEEVGNTSLAFRYTLLLEHEAEDITPHNLYHKHKTYTISQKNPKPCLNCCCFTQTWVQRCLLHLYIIAKQRNEQKKTSPSPCLSKETAV